MSYRTVLSIAAAAILGIACVSTEAFAYRAVYRGGRVHVGGVYRGGAHRGVYVRHGVGVGAPYLYNRAACGYYPYPACY